MRQETAALRNFNTAYVRFGSKADIAPCLDFVRFTPKSGQTGEGSTCPLCAISGHSRSSKPGLVDRLVRNGEKPGWHVEAERLGSL
jgi:hypothetical protein